MGWRMSPRLKTFAGLSEELAESKYGMERFEAPERVEDILIRLGNLDLSRAMVYLDERKGGIVRIKVRFSFPLDEEPDIENIRDTIEQVFGSEVQVIDKGIRGVRIIDFIFKE